MLYLSISASVHLVLEGAFFADLHQVRVRVATSVLVGASSVLETSDTSSLLEYRHCTVWSNLVIVGLLLSLGWTAFNVVLVGSC